MPKPVITPESTAENQPAAQDGRAPRAAVRVLEIDALRGLAAVAVMVFHYTVTKLSFFNQAHFRDLKFSFAYGEEAVYLFFMISGFVILMTAERCRNVLDFAIARAARLYPAYWMAVLLSSLLINCSVGLLEKATLLDSMVNLTMTQSAWGIANLDGVFWSLYIEILFYLVVAFLIAVRRLNMLASVLLILSVAGVLIEYTLVRDVIPAVWRLPRAFPLMSFAYYFCFGVWIYRLQTSWHWAGVPAIVCLWCCAWAHGQGALAAINGSLFSAAAFGFLPWLANRVFLFLGTISYSLYLLHLNLGWAIIRWTESRGVNANVAVLLAVLGATALATLVCFTIEKPANEAVRRWRRNREASRRVGLFAAAEV